MSIIRELRRKKGMLQKELADACCVHQTAVSQWEKGRTTPDIHSLKLLSDVLGVSVETLIGNEREDENRIRGFEKINAENASQKLGRSEFFALIITDDSMSPTLKPGDTVIINRNIPAVNGDIVAVTVADGGAVLLTVALVEPKAGESAVYNGTGIEPTIEVNLSSGFGTNLSLLTAEEDTQLSTALNMLAA